LIVQSNGTRAESHLFKIDFTGRMKYSGFSRDFRFVSAAGASAARRAMPTSGAWEGGNSGSGQSAVGLSRLALRQPAWPWARAPASGFGSAGLKGRSCVAGRRTGRRRIAKRGVDWGRTGDMAHLDACPLFRFLFAMSRIFSSVSTAELLSPVFASRVRRRHSPRRVAAPLDTVISGSPPHARIEIRSNPISVQCITRRKHRFLANSRTKTRAEGSREAHANCGRANPLSRFAPLPDPHRCPWQ
jgi:hypothetical protein